MFIVSVSMSMVTAFAILAIYLKAMTQDFLILMILISDVDNVDIFQRLIIYL